MECAEQCTSISSVELVMDLSVDLPIAFFNYLSCNVGCSCCSLLFFCNGTEEGGLMLT